MEWYQNWHETKNNPGRWKMGFQEHQGRPGLPSLHLGTNLWSRGTQDDDWLEPLGRSDRILYTVSEQNVNWWRIGLSFWWSYGSSFTIQIPTCWPCLSIQSSMKVISVEIQKQPKKRSTELWKSWRTHSPPCDGMITLFDLSSRPHGIVWSR